MFAGQSFFSRGEVFEFQDLLKIPKPKPGAVLFSPQIVSGFFHHDIKYDGKECLGFSCQIKAKWMKDRGWILFQEE